MKEKFFKRLLRLPDTSFFLFGPRGAGKSTWLRDVLPQAVFFDLLDSSLYLELSRHPEKLESMVPGNGDKQWVVIDEIQKIPALLDEVHRLIEKRRWRFALCGSSARKLRHGGVNLLGGRAITLSMESFVEGELDKDFDLDFCMKWGTLPLIHFHPANAAELLSSYVNTYIKEEIKEEGIVRQLPPFMRFLEVCGLMNGQVVNALNISRNAGIPRSTVDVYFSILTDSMLGHFLPAYKPGIKVRETSHPKFYWFDPGVARAASGLLFDKPDRIWYGTALETLLYHELRVYNQVSGRHRKIFYYGTTGGWKLILSLKPGKGQFHQNPA